MMKQLLAVMALGSLVACAAPITHSPTATLQEIEAEKNAQLRAAKDNPFPPIVEPVARTGAMKERLQKVAMRVTPEATKLCYEFFGMHEEKACNFNLEIEGNRGVNAYADGNKVVLSAPMMLFARDDNHLAFVVAHELAHNIMDHIDAQRGNVLIGAVLGGVLDALAASQGANTQGGFMRTGANAGLMSYSPAFEQEADYVGLYILARAGYQIEKAPDFWRAMAQFEPNGIYARSTHPTYPERFIAMSKVIVEIREKQKTKQPILPNLKPKDVQETPNG